MQTIPRRASATEEELAARRRDTTGQGHTTTNAPAVTEYDAEPTRGVTPRSAVRYRPLNRQFVIPLTDGTELRVTERELADMPKEYRQAAILLTPPPAKKPSLPPPQARPVQTDDLPAVRKRRFRFHWLFWVGVALFVMLIGYVLFNLVANWWQVTQDDWHYGRPRTFQIDANVGHGTASNPTSHFIAINLNSRIEVIEIPGDQASKSLIYVGPQLLGDGQDLTPVTLSFEGGTKDHPNMIIHVADSKFIFLNKQVNGVWKFVPAPNQ